MPLRVLVTGAGGPAGRAPLRQCAARGVDAAGVDMVEVPDSPLPVRIVPPARDDDYLDAMRAAVRAVGADVVVPTVSEELPRIADARDAFGADVFVAVSPPEAVRLADDKLVTERRLADRGVPVPRTATPHDLTAPGDAERRVGLPLVVKPRVSRGARGVRVVRDASALGPLDEHLLLQSFAPGTEYAPVVHAPLDGGAPFFVRVLDKTGLSAGEVGNATGVRPADGPDTADVARAALDAVSALGLVGPVDVDVRRDDTGRPVVLELNARFGANSEAVPGLFDHLLDDLRRIRGLVP
ncbi:carbamoyl-phosphate synthase large subunit [Pseudoclavibacter chungangensis]|nr:ATP-grasp domain-containing protein [Pseudoclavibacter chungangensis]NYJ67807.1 carbamoyl-phosphate synthase large subunit [Pseudoclavibacter chungangensis]